MNDKPNILLITTDQQRLDTVGRFKPSFMRTPHLDTLAAEGVTFTRAYADCPLCVPARVSIMNGRYAVNHGVTMNGRSADVLGLTHTLPWCLSRAGYQTFGIGKMHFTPARSRHGFGDILLPADYYREMRERGYDVQPMRNGLGQNELTPGMATVPEALTNTAWIAEKCREFIAERRDPSTPFFLWCSFGKPHPPFDPPEPYYSMYRNSAIPQPVRSDWSRAEDRPEAFKRQQDCYNVRAYTDDVLREAKAAYLGQITQIDYNIGRVLAALRAINDSGGLDETLIVFASDHGEYLGDHHCVTKSFFHESPAHIPMIVKPPRSWEEGLYGTECPHLATHADILPTCARVAGSDIPDGVDGLDLTALARGDTNPRAMLEAIIGESAADRRASIAITDGDWKYLWFPEGGSEQLFDLVNDPGEAVNLSGSSDHSDIRDRLRRELARRHADRDYGYVRDGDLVAMPVIDDTSHGRRKLHNWAIGYTTEYTDADTLH